MELLDMNGGRKRSISSRPPCDRIRRRINLAIPALLLSLLIGSAIASPISAERQAGLLAPSFPNPNAASLDRFTVIGTHGTSDLGRDIPKIYGIAGLIEEENSLKLLMLTSFSGPLTNSGYDIVTTTPMPVTPSPRNSVSWIFLLGIVGMILSTVIIFVFLPAFVLARITVGFSARIEALSAWQTRLFLSPLIAACLIAASAVIIPFLGTVSAGVIEAAVLVMLISMGVLTPWPLFRERVKVVKPRTAVFVCGIGTFFVVMLGIVPWTQFPFPGTILIALARSFSSAGLYSVLSYLESVILAIVLYSIILLWDRVKRHRQNHMPAEGEDQ